MTGKGRTCPHRNTHLPARAVVVSSCIIPVRWPEHDRALDVD